MAEGSPDRGRRSPSLERIDRPASLYRPPVRSLASPRLSTEEADELTNPNLPYRTGYTYAFSKAYRTVADDDYEIPNMGGTGLYQYDDLVHSDIVTSSSYSSYSSNVFYSAYQSLVTLWYRLVTSIYCTLATTYTGGRSLLEWIYYILYSAAYGVWYAVSVGGRSIFESAYLVLYSIVYGIWYALDKVGRSSYYIGGSAAEATIDLLTYPFKVLSNFVSSKPKRVSYNDDNQIRYFNQDDSVSVGSDDSDDHDKEEEKSSSFSLFAFSPFAFFRRRKRTHMEPIYELRSRTIEKEVMDSEPDTDMDEGSSVVHHSFHEYTETPPAPPMIARVPLKRAQRHRKVTYYESTSEYVERILSFFFFPFYLVYRATIALVLLIFNSFYTVMNGFIEGSVNGSLVISNFLLTILDILLIQPATAFVNWTISPLKRSSQSVAYIHEEEDPSKVVPLTLLRSYADERNENVESPFTRRVIRSTDAVYDKEEDDDDFAPLPTVARSRRSRSRRTSTSSSHSDGDTHITTTTTTTTIRRRSGRTEYMNGKTGNGRAKNVVDTLLFAPVRNISYFAQNTVNYALAPVYYLFSSNSSTNTGRKRKTSTSSSSVRSASGSSEKYAPVGGVVWAVKDSATTFVTKTFDLIEFFLYFIRELLTNLWQFILAVLSTLVSFITTPIAYLWSGLKYGTSGGASVTGGAVRKVGETVGVVAEESWDVMRDTGSSIGSGIAAIWTSRPSACSCLKFLFLLLPLFLFFLWLYAIPPFDKENETVNEYIKHVNTIAEDYYAYGSKRSKSFLAAAWDNIYYVLATLADLLRMLIQATVLGIYGVYSFFMDAIASAQLDRWTARGGNTPVIVEEPLEALPIPPVVVAPTVECPPPAPPVIIHSSPSAEDQEALIAAIVAKVTAQMEKRMDESLTGRIHIIEETVSKAEAELRSKVTIEHEPIDYTALGAMIAAAIKKYDSDKTGLVDFALESSGGQIISTRCSETYPLATRLEKIFNIPLFYSNFGPRVVIQRNSQGLVPGECWAFKGGIGYLTIKLAHPINVSSVSYEHIPPSLSPSGENLSAPKKFSIFSYENDEYNFESRTLLGQYEYDNKGEPLQFFKVDVAPAYPVQIIEFQVDSNHGQDKYTCLYRFRVHGDLYKPL